MSRPVVGIVACARSLGDEIAQSVIHRYLEAVVRFADCAAVLVPGRPDLFAATEVADRLDGVLLTGSPSNIEPRRYGSEEAGSGPFDPGRDAMSLALLDAMTARGRPVLGICRGFQEINVAFGGTLARDLGEGARDLPHHAPREAGLAVSFGHVHEVELVAGGALREAIGRDRLSVSSVHYQGVDRLGSGLAIEAVAPDGVVEAVSAEVNGAAILGVQWHPEWGVEGDPASQAIFALFGERLRAGKERQG